MDGKAEFRFEPGPIFANIVLGDEINRAPAKVQAAMLEAMEERQVTDPRRFARDHGDETLRCSVDDLIAASYSGAERNVDLRDLTRALARARAELRGRTKRAARPALPPLNP